ncbi:Uncharacterized protein TCM_014914 [Theobroma cacao]|uniref:Uncharacterized protein n=1 Tax=Theobroma cacao TaxID=3641 RepID=A0A061G0E7_THECC|nr:Uncharacterized protein TCM_014914 [Theobroma cacao]
MCSIIWCKHSLSESRKMASKTCLSQWEVLFIVMLLLLSSAMASRDIVTRSSNLLSSYAKDGRLMSESDTAGGPWGHNYCTPPKIRPIADAIVDVTLTWHCLLTWNVR